MMHHSRRTCEHTHCAELGKCAHLLVSQWAAEAYKWHTAKSVPIACQLRQLTAKNTQVVVFIDFAIRHSRIEHQNRVCQFEPYAIQRLTSKSANRQIRTLYLKIERGITHLDRCSPSSNNGLKNPKPKPQRRLKMDSNGSNPTPAASHNLTDEQAERLAQATAAPDDAVEPPPARPIWRGKCCGECAWWDGDYCRRCTWGGSEFAHDDMFVLGRVRSQDSACPAFVAEYS